MNIANSARLFTYRLATIDTFTFIVESHRTTAYRQVNYYLACLYKSVCAGALDHLAATG